MGTFSSIMASGHPIICGVGFFFPTKTIIANEANGDGSSMTWQGIEIAVNNSSRHWPVPEVHPALRKDKKAAIRDGHTLICVLALHCMLKENNSGKQRFFPPCISWNTAPLEYNL